MDGTTALDELHDRWRSTGGDAGSEASPLVLQLSKIQVDRTGKDGEQRTIRSLEFGGGVTTLILNSKGLRHTTIVHESGLARRLQDALPDGATAVVVAPVDHGWYDWLPPFGVLFDIVVIGGPPQFTGSARCVEVVKEILAPGGVVFVGDAHQPARRQISEQLCNVLGLRAQKTGRSGAVSDILLPDAQPLGDGPGTELLLWLKKLPNMPPCQICYHLAQKMNGWGVEGCREHMEFIVEDMLGRARRWWLNSTVWMKADAWFKGQGHIVGRLRSFGRTAIGDIDGALRESIRAHVEAAIQRAEAAGARGAGPVPEVPA